MGKEAALILLQPTVTHGNGRAVPYSTGAPVTHPGLRPDRTRQWGWGVDTDFLVGPFSYPFSILPPTCSLNLLSPSWTPSSLPALQPLPGIIGSLVSCHQPVSLPEAGAILWTPLSLLISLAHSEPYYGIELVASLALT